MTATRTLTPIQLDPKPEKSAANAKIVPRIGIPEAGLNPSSLRWTSRQRVGRMNIIQKFKIPKRIASAAKTEAIFGNKGSELENMEALAIANGNPAKINPMLLRKKGVRILFTDGLFSREHIFIPRRAVTNHQPSPFMRAYQSFSPWRQGSSTTASHHREAVTEGRSTGEAQLKRAVCQELNFRFAWEIVP